MSGARSCEINVEDMKATEVLGPIPPTVIANSQHLAGVHARILRPGTAGHKRAVARMFRETFNPYKPTIIDWPRLDGTQNPGEVQRAGVVGDDEGAARQQARQAAEQPQPVQRGELGFDRQIHAGHASGGLFRRSIGGGLVFAFALGPLARATQPDRTHPQSVAALIAGCPQGGALTLIKTVWWRTVRKPR